MRITIVIPFSGRVHCLGTMFRFLQIQTYQHTKIDFLAFDTARNPVFSDRLKEYIKKLKGYTTQYILDDGLDPGIADVVPRPHEATCKYLCGLYNKIKTHINTDYVWFLDDDTIPIHANSCYLLFRGFNAWNVFSVSGAYELNPDRYCDPKWQGFYTCWNNPRKVESEEETEREGFLKLGKGITPVGGNGFGCVVMRHLRHLEFVFDPGFEGGIDEQTYLHMAGKGFFARMNWNVLCTHMSRRGGIKLS